MIFVLGETSAAPSRAITILGAACSTPCSSQATEKPIWMVFAACAFLPLFIAVTGAHSQEWLCHGTFSRSQSRPALWLGRSARAGRDARRPQGKLPLAGLKSGHYVSECCEAVPSTSGGEKRVKSARDGPRPLQLHAHLVCDHRRLKPGPGAAQINPSGAEARGRTVG
jgi:hypothetical protein